MRIYSYGARAPVENATLVHEQLRLAHAYQRALVLVEHRRRAAIDHLYQRACQAEWTVYRSAVDKVTAAIEGVRQMRTRPGDMLPPDEEMKAEMRQVATVHGQALAAARDAEKVTRQAWYDAKKKATPKLRRRLRMCDRGAYARGKVIYARAGAVGLAWGTRLKVAESVERAAKASQKIGVAARMPRFDGGGALAVQLQGGLDPTDCLAGTDTRFRVDIVDNATWQRMQGKSAYTSTKKDGRVVALAQPDPNSHRSRGKVAQNGTALRAPRQLAIVRLRIGSNGRAPVWAAWPIVLHRPLPPKAAIKWVQAHACKVGPRTEWSILVTVEDEAPQAKTKGETLAINLGWRNLPSGSIRVAYAVGSDGHEEEVLVPSAYVAGVSHVASLQSIRDKLFEEAKKFIGDYRDENERPAWFMEATRYFDRWRSQKHLVWLLRNWRENRFSEDTRALDIISAWAKKDRHLWFWESDERTKLLRMRKDCYRATAARLAVKYARIVVTDMDLRDFAEKEAPEEKDSTGKTQRVTQRLAAPSELRGAIKNACSTRGTAFEEVDAKYKTQTCNHCGIVFAFAAKQDLAHTCECGARWDQDANHCRNLLASDHGPSKTGPSLAASEKHEVTEESGKKGRWQKRRSKTIDQAHDIARKTG